MKRIIEICLLLITFSPSMQIRAEEAPIVPGSFAFARNISVVGDAPLFEFELTEEIYKHLARNDLGDIRIFNAAGTDVPYQLNRQNPEVQNSSYIAPLSFFPITGKISHEDGGGAVEISEDKTGKLVQVHFSGKKSSSRNAKQYYLIDLRKQEHSVRALDIDSSGLEPNRIIPVEVASSSDLKSWSPVFATGALANMSFHDEEVKQNRLELTPQRFKFLRIGMEGGKDFAVEKISGEFLTTSTLPLTMHWSAPQGRKESPGTIEYDASAHFPVSSLRVKLPEQNSLMQVRISSRATPEAVWVQRYSGSVYRLGGAGGEISSRDVSLTASVNDRYWILEVKGKDSALGGSLPVLELGWYPHQLSFLARGQGPFQLSYGSARVSPPDFGIADLRGALSGSKVGTQKASLEAERLVGGESLLVPAMPPIEIPWKKWILWAALVGFLLAIATMAVRLAKDLKRS